MRVLGKVLANAAALFATTLVPGIVFTGSLPTLLLAGVLLGIFNFVVRPLALLLSLPLLVLSLGLFYFVLNGILLWAASFVLPGYSVGGLVPGILGALVMTVVNWAIHALFGGDRKR
jgi:putative membrane protein